MKILVIGQGGREHALAWKLSQSRRVSAIFVAPGNPGTAQIGANVDLQVTAATDLANWAASTAIDLTIVGPEAALAAGVVDAFRARGLPILGPTRAAARLENPRLGFAPESLVKHIPETLLSCITPLLRGGGQKSPLAGLVVRRYRTAGHETAGGLSGSAFRRAFRPGPGGFARCCQPGRQQPETILVTAYAGHPRVGNTVRRNDSTSSAGSAEPKLQFCPTPHSISGDLNTRAAAIRILRRGCRFHAALTT